MLRLIAGGMVTHLVAQALSFSPLTARNHVANVMDKLGVASRLQAVIVASQLGLL